MTFKNYLASDFRSSIIVFLVALPLCLGIALASGAPLFAGVIAGVVGGIVVGALSASPLSVSGPAAGLTSIVAASILELGSYQVFLASVMLAGIFQIVLGYLKAGSIGHFFPASVIKGMLAGIGLILILKQIPHAVGYDIDFEGDERFFQFDDQNTFSEIANAWELLTPGAITISLISMVLLFAWDSKKLQRYKFFRLLPAPLGVVIVGISINLLFRAYWPYLNIDDKHMVNLPQLSDGEGISSLILFPDFSLWRDPKIYFTAITIGVVASLETLLSVEACDKLDPYRRLTPLNRELKAQGAANFISGFLGGLPLTSVIVRSSTNINSGARTKASAISHGILLLVMVLIFPQLLQMIPLASLAAILIIVGYKLSNLSMYQRMFSKGWSQFLPFITTVVAVIFTNLLQGVFMGMLVAVFFILRTNFREAIIMVSQGDNFLLKTTKDVSFLNKANLRKKLQLIPPNAEVTIDGTNSNFIDEDIKETIEDFMKEGIAKNINVNLKKIAI